MRKNKNGSIQEFVKIESIQNHIGQKFRELGYPIASIEFDFPILFKFARNHSFRLKIDYDLASKKLSDVWFAIASVQLSIGYMLVAKDSAKFPRGYKQTTLSHNGLEIDMNIGDLHFWYHHNMAVECIYRVWERITNLLKFYCNIKGIRKRMYYNDIIRELKKNSIYSKLGNFGKLLEYEKHWVKIAGQRNKLSHEECRLLGDDKIYILDSNILRCDEKPFQHVQTLSPDLFQVIDNIKNKYIRCSEVFKAALQFIEELPTVNH
jgi:hypothetical protein